MTTTRRVLLMAMTALAIAAAGGCSPAISAWCDRGDEGLAMSDNNFSEFHRTAAALVAEQEALATGAPFADLRALLARAEAVQRARAMMTVQEKIPAVPVTPAGPAPAPPATQPAPVPTPAADPPPAIPLEIELDDAWITEAQAMLAANIKALRDKAFQLDRMLDAAKLNNARTRESLTRIRALNRFWAGANSELAVQVARMADEVARLRAERTPTK